MKTRKLVIGAVLVIVGLPVMLILIVVVSVTVLDRTNGTIVSSGKPRSYLLYVPRSYGGAKPTPLVISMHGAAGWPAQQMNLSGWNRLACAEDAAVVLYTIEGGGHSWPGGKPLPGWWVGPTTAASMQRVRCGRSFVRTGV